MKTMTDYEQQAKDFLRKWGIDFSVKRGFNVCPPFCDGKHIHGDQYRVTLRRPLNENCLTFPFWNSKRDSKEGKEPTVYDVLACISSDLYCPQGFEEFCSEYGYDTDSIKAMKTFTRCQKFAAQLNAFFDNEEMRADLSNIN